MSDSWRDQASCIDMDPELFFPDTSVSPAAQRACNNCTVQKSCLDWALRHERFGFWGGYNERERRILRKAMGITYVELMPHSQHSFLALVR